MAEFTTKTLELSATNVPDAPSRKRKNKGDTATKELEHPQAFELGSNTFDTSVSYFRVCATTDSQQPCNFSLLQTHIAGEEKTLDDKTKSRHFKHDQEKEPIRTTPLSFKIDAFDWFTCTAAEIKQKDEQTEQLNKLIDFFNIQGAEINEQGHNVELIKKEGTGCSTKDHENSGQSAQNENKSISTQQCQRSGSSLKPEDKTPASCCSCIYRFAHFNV
jgi:hypothetical protein